MNGAALCALLATGCGAAMPSSVQLAEERFREPAAETAQRDAPDLYASAKAALAQAKAAAAAGDRTAADEYAMQARLRFAAAVATSDLSRLEAQRMELAKEEAVANRRALDADAALAARILATERAEAARLAMDEAQQAFAQAEVDEGKAPRKGRFAVGEYPAAVRALTTRARLLAAAARALGADAAACAAVESRITAAAAIKNATASLGAMDRAVLDALALLGTARGKNPAPTDGERQALAEEAASYGLSVQGGMGGVRVGVTSAKPNADRLRALLLAHPHGAVLLLGEPKNTARLVADFEARGVPAGRVTAAPADAPGTTALLFTVY